MGSIVSLLGDDLSRLVDDAIAVNHSFVDISRISDQFSQVLRLLVLPLGLGFCRVISIIIGFVYEIPLSFF